MKEGSCPLFLFGFIHSVNTTLSLSPVPGAFQSRGHRGVKQRLWMACTKAAPGTHRSWAAVLIPLPPEPPRP